MAFEFRKIAAPLPYTILYTHICSMVGQSIASAYVYIYDLSVLVVYISAMVLPTVPYVCI